MIQPGKIINLEAPVIYRLIVKKMLSQYPHGRISRDNVKYLLGSSFKIGKEKQKVMKELEDFGLLIKVNKQEYFLNFLEVKE